MSIQQLLDETGAVPAYRENKMGAIRALVFPLGSDEAKAGHIVLATGTGTVTLRGHSTTKAGRAFNLPMRDANARMEVRA